MYNSFIKWIGSKTCNIAGDLSTVLDAGHACASGHATSMGIIVLGLLVFALTVMVINARRRQRRENRYL